MTRRRHTDADIEEALRHVEDNGWRVELRSGHVWARIYCPYNDKECRGGDYCIATVFGTPRNSGNHAKQIRKVVDKCIHHHVEDD